MNMSLLQSVVMGLVSGLAELLPISAEAHRTLLRTVFGIGQEDALFRLFAHLACLISLIAFHRGELLRLRRANHLMKIPPRRRKHPPEMASVYTIRLLKTAGILLIVGKIFTMQLSFIGDQLQYLAAALVLNGILLLIPSLVRVGNKDSRNMPRLDGLLMGLGAGLSVIPGVSQVGATVSVGTARGVDRQYALQFAYFLMIPGLIVDLIFDCVALAGGGMAVFSGKGLLIALFGAVFAWVGSWIAQRIMGFLSRQSGFSGFAYYSWGAALLCFILFLTV